MLFFDDDTQTIPAEDAAAFLQHLVKLAAQENESADPAAAKQILDLMAAMASHEFKLNQWYVYYSSVIRGCDRGGLVELFEELAEKELDDAKYLLRHLMERAAGPFKIPVVPAPSFDDDPLSVTRRMMAEEQRGIDMLKQLHAYLGEDPFHFTVEQMISDEMDHHARLGQYTFATAEQKIAAAQQAVKRKVQAPEDMEIEQYLAADSKATAQQLAAENEDLRGQVAELAQVADAHAQDAEEANAMAQQAQEESAMSQESAAAAMQEAQMGQTAAAAEADAKARVAIRLQQMRQQLADIVATDPVAEEGADAPAILTSSQQGMPDPAMGGDPNAMALEDPNAAAMAPGAPPQGQQQQAAPQKKVPAEKKPESSGNKKKDDGKDHKVEVKVAAALNKLVTKLQRGGQLISGSKAKELASNAERYKGFSEQLRTKAQQHAAAGRTVKAEEGHALAHHSDAAHITNATQAHHEAKKVRNTRAAVGVGAAGGLGYAGAVHAEKKAEDTAELRRKAHRSSVASGATFGTIGGALAGSRWQSNKAMGIGAGLGLAAGAFQGHRGFHKDDAGRKLQAAMVREELEKEAGIATFDDLRRGASRAKELFTGSKLKVLRAEAAQHRSGASRHYRAAAATRGELGPGGSSVANELSRRDLEQTVAGNRRMHHANTLSERAHAEGNKVRATRAGAGIAIGVAGGAHALTKEPEKNAGVKDKVVHHVKDVLHRTMDDAGTRARAVQLGRDVLKPTANKLVGGLAAGSVISSAASVHQGRKTRKEIKALQQGGQHGYEG